ncbi:MAG: hypothetical protein ACE5Q4_02795 [Nitrosopumilus sp.]
MTINGHWTGLQDFSKKVSSLTKNSKNLQRDFLNLVTKEVLIHLRNITPKDTGETANAWFIEKKTRTSVTIGNRNEDILLLIQKGHKGGEKIFPDTAQAFRFEIGGQEFFRTFITTKTQNPNPFMLGIVEGLDKFNKALMDALIKKYWKVFKNMQAQSSPSGVKLRNISKQSGIGQGTKRSRNRGRGGGFQRRTGKISNRRRLGRRRRTGKFISSKEVKMK